GTVGLSLGITGELTVTSKIIFMFLMFVGRVGVITFLFIFIYVRSEVKFHYTNEKIIFCYIILLTLIICKVLFYIIYYYNLYIIKFVYKLFTQYSVIILIL